MTTRALSRSTRSPTEARCHYCGTTLDHRDLARRPEEIVEPEGRRVVCCAACAEIGRFMLDWKPEGKMATAEEGGSS